MEYNTDKYEIEELYTKLQDEYERLREITQKKDDILTNVSHELKTPLTIAYGTIELAIDEENAKKRRKLLDGAKRALDRQNYVISDLIEASTIKNGDYRTNNEDIKLGPLIDASLDELNSFISEKNINVIKKIKQIPRVRADGESIKHVIINLINNAVKFNKNGGEIIIEASYHVDGLKPLGAGFVEVSITDTGIGIPKGQQDKLFTSLYQIDSGTTRKYSGIGLGLTLVKDIIELHKGRIKVESEESEGSKFIFTLPATPKGDIKPEL